MTSELKQRIYEENIAVHQYESKCYELLHPEIYGGREQKRLSSSLKLVDKLIKSSQRSALDFGAGTGNLTDKLLQLGYNVTAIDISSDMCKILTAKYKKYMDEGKLTVINKPIEDVSFNESEFGLICCYSVLHHLPDYLNALRKLATFLQKGGVMYLDHEESPFFWEGDSSKAARRLRRILRFSDRLINQRYFRIKMLSAKMPPYPNLDYGLSDYWICEEHHINHKKIEHVFKEYDFDFFTRIDYHLNKSWLFNPVFYVYKYTCKPDMSCWIARK